MTCIHVLGDEMKNVFNKKSILIVMLIVLFGQAFAQLEIKRSSINSGGGSMTGGNFEMHSSMAQVDASATQTGGNFSLNGGFWHKDNTPKPELIFANGFE